MEESEATIAALTIPTDEVGLAATLETTPNLRLRVEQTALNKLEHKLPVWVSGAGEATVEESFEADPSLDSYARLGEMGDETLYELAFETAMTAVPRLVVQTGGTILRAGASDGEWRLTVRFSSREELRSAYDALVGRDVDVSLDKISDEEQRNLAEQLSAEQYESLEVAFESGYFEVPRKATLGEIAEKLGISHQAASERLRRAERKTLTTLFDSQFGDEERTPPPTDESR